MTEKYLEQQRMRLPAHVFQRLHENKWTQGENAFLTKAEVEACKDYSLKPQLSGKEGIKYYLAVDLGLTRDRTVLTICHKDMKENLIYLDYIKTYQGSKKNPVIISDIEEDIIWANDNFNVQKNIFDPWQMKSTAQRMRSQVKIEEFTFTTSTIQKLSQNLYYLFHNGLIRIFPHNLLEEELLNINAEEKSYGWRIDHKSGGFSDHVVSVGMSSMYAVQDEKGSAGVLITDSPSMDEFQKRRKEEEKHMPIVKREGEKKEVTPASQKSPHPTLKDFMKLKEKRGL